jgi:prevent-host-death family protein
MEAIGSNAARTQLSQLLDQVARGKKVLITRRGKPAALLVPPPKKTKGDVRRVVQAMLEFRDRDGPTLRGEATLRELIDEGRRF